MSNTAIKLKKSSVVGKAPGVDDLQYGEVAINYADGRIYYKNSSNEIKYFIDSDGLQTFLDQKLNVDGTSIMTGTLDMGVNSIINLTDPITDQGAATKKYVDDAVEAGVGSLNFPTGDWGLVDSDELLDAFGIAISGDYYDMSTQPANDLGSIDLGSNSSI